jgi:prepilin-type processing-associated H-X9-DG protein
MARESARSVACKSRLRNLIAAVLQYEGAHRMLPLVSYADNSPSQWNSKPSIQLQSLPFLEHSDLYDQINFELPIVSTLAVWNLDRSAFATVTGVQVGSFICPSDGRTFQVRGSINYRASVGNGPMWHRSATFPDSDNGAFTHYRYPARLAGIIDGTAFTAALSERVIGGSAVEKNPTVRHAYLQTGVEALGIHTADDQLRVCAAIGPSGAFDVYWSPGSSWLASGQDNTLYAHCFPPNSAVIDCIAAEYSAPLGAATARSMHPGMVHAAFLDGSVRAVGDAINAAVWRALGSRDGAEIVLASEF